VLSAFQALTQDIKADAGTRCPYFSQNGRKSHESAENKLVYDTNGIPSVLAAFNGARTE
jgi:hypothetical protein